MNISGAVNKVVSTGFLSAGCRIRPIKNFTYPLDGINVSTVLIDKGEEAAQKVGTEVAKIIQFPKYHPLKNFLIFSGKNTMYGTRSLCLIDKSTDKFVAGGVEGLMGEGKKALEETQKFISSLIKKI